MKIPIVLPVVRVRIDGVGALTVDVDGAAYGSDRDLRRGDLRSVLDEITGSRQSPVRVEVVERDGTTYADIAAPPIESEAVAAAAPLPRHSMSGISGSGFLPGEQVAIAFVLLHQTADEAGSAIVNLPPSVLVGRRTSMVMFGLDSNVMARVEATA
jgi:hypothetical protein